MELRDRGSRYLAPAVKLHRFYVKQLFGLPQQGAELAF